MLKMLFLLKELEGAGVFHLFSNKEYVVGRKNADIVIDNDQSISRKHAVIRIGFNSATITDCGSKYGSSHNNKKLSANTETVLKNMDVIKFGVFQSKYRLEEMNVVTTASGLTNDQKLNLKKKISQVNGTFVNNWDDTCTYLTAQEIMLTIKVLHALIDDKPIVTLQYWDHFVENVKASKPPPKVENYRPPVTETLIHKVDLSAKPERKTVFKNKVFVFTTEKIRKKMADLITKAGGTSISWEKSPVTLSEITNTKDYLFIKNDDQDDKCDPSLTKIYQHLSDLGERIIPIQEIAMAVVLCSCEKDCNPKFNRVHNVFKAMPCDSLSEVFSLAQATPSDDGWVDQIVTKKEVVIPESLDAENNLFAIPKNIHNVLEKKPVTVGAVEIEKNALKRPETEEDGNVAKRVKIDASASGSKDHFAIPAPSTSRQADVDGFEASASAAMPLVVSNKRKADDNLSNPTKKNQMFMDLTNSGSKKINPCNVANKRKADENVFFAPKTLPKTRKPSIVKNDPDNSFVALRLKEERPTGNRNENNPFLQIRNESKRDDRPAVEPVMERTFDISAVDLSENYVPTNTVNVTWISSNNATKTEPLSPADPEMQEIFEQFKDSVVIEVLPSYAVRIKTPMSTQESFNSSQGDRKNFKKFRKVRPLRPQTTILSTSLYDDIRSDGEEDPEASVLQPVKRKGPKAFNF